MVPRNGTPLPQLSASSVQVVVQGGVQEGPSGHLRGGGGADSPMSSQIKKAERRALPGAQASPEGPAQGWGPISPRMSAAPEPSYKAKKKKAPEGADGFRHFCVSQDEGQYLWNSKRSSTNGVNRSWRPVKDCQSLAKNRENFTKETEYIPKNCLTKAIATGMAVP